MLPKLEAAFAGDPDRFPTFWLYAWDTEQGRFTMVRRPSEPG